MTKSLQIIPEKSIFDDNDVIGDVTAWLQRWPSIFMFEWNYHIFHNNYTTFWHMITSLYVWMYHGCKTMSMEIGDDDVIDGIIKSKSISTIWTASTWLIFKLERRTQAQNVVNWTGSLGVALISKSSQSLQSSLSYEWSSFWKFWQVRNLRLLFHYLPKFSILASMFVWRFVWSSDCLSVCLSVCLSGMLLARYRSHRLTNHHQTWPK